MTEDQWPETWLWFDSVLCLPRCGRCCTTDTLHPGEEKIQALEIHLLMVVFRRLFNFSTTWRIPDCVSKTRQSISCTNTIQKSLGVFIIASNTQDCICVEKRYLHHKESFHNNTTIDLRGGQTSYLIHILYIFFILQSWSCGKVGECLSSTKNTELLVVGVYSNVLHLYVHICILRYCVVGNGFFLVVMGIKNTKKTTLMTGLF